MKSSEFGNGSVRPHGHTHTHWESGTIGIKHGSRPGVPIGQASITRGREKKNTKAAQTSLFGQGRWFDVLGENASQQSTLRLSQWDPDQEFSRHGSRAVDLVRSCGPNIMIANPITAPV